MAVLDILLLQITDEPNLTLPNLFSIPYPNPAESQTK